MGKARSGHRRPTTLTGLLEKPTNVLRFGLHGLQAFFWKVSNFVEGISWTLIDSWRKPDMELFTRSFTQACIQELRTASQTPSLYNIDKPIIGFFSGDYFYLRTLQYAPFPYYRPVRLVVAGKFWPTPHGTYVRAWHRAATSGILSILVFGIILACFFCFLGAHWLQRAYPQVNADVVTLMSCFIIAPVFTMIVFRVSVWISSRVGKTMNADLVGFIRMVLLPDRSVMDYSSRSR